MSIRGPCDAGQVQGPCARPTSHRNAFMNTVSRNGVEFDMCPICRGVWLDRGELENLMASQGGRSGQPPPPMPIPDLRNDRYDRGHDDSYRRKKRDSIFDIFD